jgi:hypothetical protein
VQNNTRIWEFGCNISVPDLTKYLGIDGRNFIIVNLMFVVPYILVTYVLL